MKCTSCGEFVAQGARFCPDCGTAVSPALSCRSCGGELLPGKKFCAACGCPVDGDRPHCGPAGHNWQGCVCADCGQTRKEQHRFEAVPGACRQICYACGAIETAHNFQPVPGRCIEQCLGCGETKELPHSYGRDHRCTLCGQRAPRTYLNTAMDIAEDAIGVVVDTIEKFLK